MSPVQFVSLKVDVPKEFDDACNAVEGIVADLKAGKPIEEIALGRLKDLAAAIAGAEQIPVEAKEAMRAFTERSGLLAGRVTGTLLSPKVVPV